MSHIKFTKLKQVNNPASIHGVYPYRGKIASVEAASITKQIPKSSVILDPFCGSGTIIYEGIKNNLCTIGVDNNPLAIWISKGKIDSLQNNLTAYETELKLLIQKALNKKNIPSMPHEAKKHFHKKTAEEIMSLIPFLNEMSDYARATFFGTIALAARGCNHYKWTSSTVGKDITPKRYISFYDKYRQKIIKHHSNEVGIQQPKAMIYLNDSRKLSQFIPPNSVDFVFTSPPYFDGLDYTAYYGKLIYWILKTDRIEIRKGLIQTVQSYEEDMKKVLNEIIKVTKKNAQIIFVVGDKKIGKEIINGGEFFSKLLHHKPNQIIERDYTGTSSQVFDKLNNTKRKEQIVIWDKGSW